MYFLYQEITKSEILLHICLASFLVNLIEGTCNYVNKDHFKYFKDNELFFTVVLKAFKLLLVIWSCSSENF